MRFIPGKTLKYGSHSILIIGMGFVIVIALNFLMNRYHIRKDITESKAHSLSEQTLKVLDSVDTEITINIFCPAERRDFRWIRKVTEMIHYSNPLVKVVFYDPVKNPVKAKAYNVTEERVVVVERGEKRFSKSYRENEFWQEKDLANAILRVMSDRNKVVYFVTGHGERDIYSHEQDGFSTVREELESAAYDVQNLIFVTVDSIPVDADIVVVPRPVRPYSKDEIIKIRGYIQRGGDVFFMLDPGDSTGFEDFLQRYDVKLGNDFIIDKSREGRMANVRDPSSPVVVRYSKSKGEKTHEILKNHTGVMTIYPQVRSINFRNKHYDIEIEPIVFTSPQSWAETDLEAFRAKKPFKPTKDRHERPGPIVIAVALVRYYEDYENYDDMKDNPKKSRIVVIGDSDFATNRWFTLIKGNGDLFLNTVNWLAEEEELIAIRPKQYGMNTIRLTYKQSKWFLYFPVIIYPAIVLAVGLAVWIRRR